MGACNNLHGVGQHVRSMMLAQTQGRCPSLPSRRVANIQSAHDVSTYRTGLIDESGPQGRRATLRVGRLDARGGMVALCAQRKVFESQDGGSMKLGLECTE